MPVSKVRDALKLRLQERRDELKALCAALTAADSRNPPGDTTAVAEACIEALQGNPEIAVRKVVGRVPLVNVVATLSGARPGRRLVLNGHLDTGPLPQPERWTVPPFGGVVRDGRIYGRGVCDMKAGAAAQIMALKTLAEFRDDIAGELVLTLVADEGTGGEWGTLYLLANVGAALGDAMLSGDVGSPRVARFGEKGFLWIEVTASGKPAGGAHVYLGVNAIDRLIAALIDLRRIGDRPVAMPADIAAAIDAAGPLSEPLSGAGETAALKTITVNVGTIEGGLRINNVPSAASARIDIRFPPGIAVAEVESRVAAALARHAGVSWKTLDRAEPNWTPPGSEIAQSIARNAAETLGTPPAMTIRAGFSDSRFYRERGVPCVVYGVTPYNGNAPDEYATIDDLAAVHAVHTLTAFDFLVSTRTG